MLDSIEIIKTALQEHEENVANLDSLIAQINTNLEAESIQTYNCHSEPLSLVSFRCMLQDTGYPMEVYLPGAPPQDGQAVDWSKLKERWVGWGVEVPGENVWSELTNLNTINLNPSIHPPALQSKFPLPDRKADYLGALIKVYGDVSFKPASTHTFVGVLSTAPLPSPITASADGEEQTLVPTIHVLRVVPNEAPTAVADAPRAALVNHLASSLRVDLISAEYILLALVASPSVRPPALPPLGTLSLNLMGPVPNLSATLRDLVAASVDLPLTLQTLHSVPFLPSSTNTSSDSSSLASGLLQLAEGTVLVIDETAMGDGGMLQEKAVRNLQALTECMAEQKVRYEYPYMDGLKMDAWIRTIVLSEGKSLVPVDVHVPVVASSSTAVADLPAFRAYLRYHGSIPHAKSLSIPEPAAVQIQEDFVAYRKAQGVSGDAEEVLKRRMKIARLLAVSYSDAVLTEERWKRVVEMDEEVQKRIKDRKK